MTPTQKLKWTILNTVAAWRKEPSPSVTAANVDALYDALVAADGHWDARNELRSSGEPSGLPVTGADLQLRRHYDCESVAAEMPDGSWVGWIYWHGGGKFGEPDAIEWMDAAYAVINKPETRVVVTNNFSLPATQS